MGDVQTVIVTIGLLAIVFAAIVAVNPAVLPIMFPVLG